MEGFLRWKIQPWQRRLISRSLAIVPAALTIWYRGSQAVDDLLVLSQVVLSLQLPFAVVPLIVFTSDRTKMGKMVNRGWVIGLSWAVAAIIIGLNVKLVVGVLGEWLLTAPGWVMAPLMLAAAVLACLLVWTAVEPWWLGRKRPTLPVEHALVLPSFDKKELVRGYKRIGVALEVGPADQAVLNHIIQLVKTSRATVVLLHVASGSMSQFLGPVALDTEVREDQWYLEDVASRLRHAGVEAIVSMGAGDPRTELVRLVREHRVDLLVTGSHRHGWLGDLLFGATASEVRHQLAIPVLTIPMKMDEVT
jgi:manganese transport protein